MEKSDRHWYPRYPGDYARKTAHLSLAAHGAYALLMDWYYANAKPLPNDWVQMHRICKAVAPDEQRYVQEVVQEFFTLRDDGWHNNRADGEIEKKAEISEKRRFAQAIREQNRLQRQVQKGCKKGANAHTSTSTSTLPSNDKSLDGDAHAVDDIKSKSKKGKDNGARLQVWYENSGCEPGSLLAGWADYPKSKFGWNDREVEHVANAFWRYWTGPDARDPIKKDWGRAWQGWCDRSNSRGEHRVSTQAAHQKPGGLSFNKILSIAEQAASQN